MNLFDTSNPFTEALKHLAAKALLPTGMSSAELRQVDAGIRRQSLFSARTLLDYHLENIDAVVGSALTPQTEQREDRVTPENPQGNVTVGLNPATARAELRQGLQDHGYVPPPGEKGTITDLSSDTRLNLIVKTNVQLAQGAGHFVQANANEDRVDLWPAWELVRNEDREVPRGERRGPKGIIVPDPGNAWPVRFGAAAEAAGDEDAQRVLNTTGRMVALKSSRVWQALGDGAGGYDDTLGNPYFPFAFNSGMATDEVGRQEAEELGLLDPGETAEPADFDLSTLFKEAA